jgi:hypothetical protein
VTGIEPRVIGRATEQLRLHVGRQRREFSADANVFPTPPTNSGGAQRATAA